MNLNLAPVKVNINIESLSLEREAFYNICFITENDVAPRTLEVRTLSDLLENGYARTDLAYNFCVGVFSQQGMPSVLIRAKRTNENYEDAYLADSNDGYYYIVLQTKDIDEVNSFNQFLASTGDLKLQFYSSNKNNITEAIESEVLVSYYHDYELGDEPVPVTNPDHYLNVAYGGNPSDGSGGDITCKPTSATISAGDDAGGVLTLSRNGAPKVALRPPSASASDEEYTNYTKQVLELTYFAQDGVSMAFALGDFIVGIEPKRDDNGNIISVMSGIPIDGVIDYVGTPYDLKEGIYDLNRLLTAGDPTIFTPNIVPEVNTVEIYPTPDTPPELDGYYAYGGDESGEPVVIRSCAKAVIESAGDETVCTPTTHTILYKSYWDNRVPSDGELHARYRVNNGEWIDYTASTVDGSDYILKLFETIELPNGDRAIELVGGTVNPRDSQTPFRSYQGQNKLIGASLSEPYSEEQVDVINQYPTTIEFEVTQNDFNDLVYLAFGESIIAKSCAIASWSSM